MPRLKPIKKVLIEYEGKLQLMTKVKFLEILRDEEAEIPKLIGTVDPYDKTGLRWEKEKEPEPVTYHHNYTPVQVARLENLVIINLDYLANKSRDVFVNNFNAVILKNIRKQLK